MLSPKTSVWDWCWLENIPKLFFCHSPQEFLTNYFGSRRSSSTALQTNLWFMEWEMLLVALTHIKTVPSQISAYEWSSWKLAYQCCWLSDISEKDQKEWKTFLCCARRNLSIESCNPNVISSCSPEKLSFESGSLLPQPPSPGRCRYENMFAGKKSF